MKHQKKFQTIIIVLLYLTNLTESDKIVLSNKSNTLVNIN